MFVIVHLNDSRVIGPFATEAAATAWVTGVPNDLFKTRAELEHADSNADFYVTAIEAPVL